MNACQIINETAVEDITHAIKENLDTEKSLSDESLTNLQYTLNLEDVFRSLAKELNFEAVVYFGNSLITTTSINDSVIAFYIKYLLFSRVSIPVLVLILWKKSLTPTLQNISCIST